MRGDKRGKFWSEVGGHVPGRSVQAVHNFCRRAFTRYNHRGRWSPPEEARLRELVSEEGKAWAKIGEELGRTQVNCRDKWKSMEASRSRGRWQLSEVINLIMLVESAAQVSLLSHKFQWKEKAEVLALKDASLKVEEGYAISDEKKVCYFWSQEVDVGPLLGKVVKAEASESAPDHDLPWKRIAKRLHSRDQDSCRIKWYAQVICIGRRAYCLCYRANRRFAALWMTWPW